MTRGSSGAVMASGFISNLINGISQQPSNIRFNNQADECVNMLPTLQEQCARRNPLECLFTLSSPAVDANSYVHFYRRDSSEAYTVLMNGTGIQVYSLVTGTAKTVTISVPGGDVYHQSLNAIDNFYLYTYKDTTFVVNRGVTTAGLGSLSSSRTPEGIIKILDCVTGYTYSVVINIGATVFTMPVYTAIASDTVNTIAAHIVSTVAALAGWGAAGGSISSSGNVVWVSHATSAVAINVTDNRSGTAMKTFQQTVNQTTDLPYYAPNGYLVTVVGSSSAQNAQSQNTAGYVVYKFLADNAAGFGSGVWQESLAGGIPYALDPATMPHQLVRNADGTFTYSQITWANRLVGSLITNPDPPFLGNPIQSCFLASGRFGLLAGSNFCLSKVGESNYFNFYNTTVLTSLATDPVSGVVPSSQVNKPFWATQWNGALMVLGDNVDASVEWTNTLSQSTISINTPTHTGISPHVAPVLSSSYLFFPKNLGAFSNLYQYKLDPLTGLKRAVNLTTYCGSYIPKDICQLVGSEQGFLLALSKVDRTKLYCYNYAENNNQTVQQAFHHWEFSPDIIIYGVFIDYGAGGAVSGTVYLVYGLGSKIFIGQILITAAATDVNYPSKCYMDSRMTEAYPGMSISYNATNNRTTITLPNSLGASVQSLFELRAAFTDSTGNRYPVGFLPTIVSQTTTSIVLAGNWTGSQFFVGLPYSSYYDPCKFQIYTPNPEGGNMIADPWKSLTVTLIALGYTNTGYYQIQIIDRATGAVVNQEDMPIKLDNVETVFDTYTLYGGFHVVPMLKNHDNYRIRLINNTTRPSFFTSLAWVGEVWDAAK